MSYFSVRLRGDERYMKAYLNDCAEIDYFLLCDAINAGEVWSLLGRAGSFRLTGLCETGDMLRMVEVMRSEMYYNKYPDKNYSPSIFTKSKAMDFINDTSDRITRYKYLFQ